jgi:hypothetical protein
LSRSNLQNGFSIDAGYRIHLNSLSVFLRSK